MNKVISKDGTAIAYEKIGSGPALILVDGALCSRQFGPSAKLAPLLAKDFTVVSYDRRGRGDSGDTQPYAKAREVEDLAALVEAAGGSAALVGLSSGAALAFEAAASGVPITKVVGYEPPFMVDDGGRNKDANHEQRLKTFVGAGQRGAAVRYFMRDMVGVPAPAAWLMTLMPGISGKLKAVAHTLPYDAAVMGDWSVPEARLRSITTPTLVMHGGKTDPRLVKAAETVAKAIPGAQHRVLAGQTHNVAPEVLTPAVTEFLRA